MKTKKVGYPLLYLMCRGIYFQYKSDNMKEDVFFRKVCNKTKKISKGRYICQLEFNIKFGGMYSIYMFDKLCLINPKLGYATNNIKKWFKHKVLGFNFLQDEIDIILYVECGKQLETSKAAKALIEAFKYIQNNEKY